MVYFLAKEIFESRKTAFLAALIYTFYPYSIYYSLYYSSEKLFLFLLCGSFYFLSRCIKKDYSLLHATLCGGMMALATLTRPQGFGLFLLLGFTGTLVMLFNKKLRYKLFKSLVF
jgi:4-amino-4-deoxy-L-arabinose transferase-like glycosyltransferase